MRIQRGWLLITAIIFTPLHVKSHPNSPGLTPRSSSESIFAQFAQVGPIIAGVLGGLSAILLLLLIYRVRRKYRLRAKMRARLAGSGSTGRKQDAGKARLLRFFGKRERSPSTYWDEYLWEKDLEAFPEELKSEPPQRPGSVASPDRPLPTIPAITRASSVREETEGAPLYLLRGTPVPSDIGSGPSLNVTNPSRTKLRVRPDPMLIQGLLAPSPRQLEERRRHDLAGFTPARRSYVGIPPPMPALVKAHLPVPPRLGVTHGRSQSDGASPGHLTPSVTEGIRARSHSAGDGDDVRRPTREAGEVLPRRRRHESSFAQVLLPIADGPTTPSPIILSPSTEAAPTRPSSRRELVLSLHETLEAAEALEEMLSVSTIDLPPLTAHSRRFSSTNNTQLRAEVEILRREVRRLQNLLLTPRRTHGPNTSPESDADVENHPPPVYST
ncbi:hypothetical protein B0H11DRAFT_2218342 [Mycena galericulata]|nr:hypothetical protein B0H11DRAFT_2218342 [Mycena galericulata]